MQPHLVKVKVGVRGDGGEALGSRFDARGFHDAVAFLGEADELGVAAALRTLRHGPLKRPEGGVVHLGTWLQPGHVALQPLLHRVNLDGREVLSTRFSAYLHALTMH